jgi:hypothetical protein
MSQQILTAIPVSQQILTAIPMSQQILTAIPMSQQILTAIPMSQQILVDNSFCSSPILTDGTARCIMFPPLVASQQAAHVSISHKRFTWSEPVWTFGWQTDVFCWQSNYKG